MSRKKWMWGTVALALVGGTAWTLRALRKEAPAFRPALVERGTVRVTIPATGVAQPQNRVEVKPPIGGRVEEVFVKEGQAVRKGGVLAYMSSTERAALLDAARAKGPEEAAHWEDLYKPTPLMAPLDGVVISRNVEPGQTVTAQDAVLVVSNRLIVKAQVDETDIARVRPGQGAFITLDAYPETSFPGTADHIAYEASTVNNVTIYEVDVKPLRPPEELRSGMTANVTFLFAEKKDVLLVPAEAVRVEEGRSTVRVPRRDGKRPDERIVKTGLTDGRVTEVLEGLSEGDTVMMRNVSFNAERREQGSSPFSPSWGGGGGRQGAGGRRRGGP